MIDEEKLRRIQKNNPTYTDVDLYNSGINDEDVKKLASAMKNNNYVTKINLMLNNDIGDDGAKALAECLSNNTTLKKIILYRNKINAEGYAALLYLCVWNPNIETMKMDYPYCTYDKLIEECQNKKNHKGISFFLKEEDDDKHKVKEIEKFISSISCFRKKQQQIINKDDSISSTSNSKEKQQHKLRWDKFVWVAAKKGDEVILQALAHTIRKTVTEGKEDFVEEIKHLTFNDINEESGKNLLEILLPQKQTVGLISMLLVLKEEVGIESIDDIQYWKEEGDKLSWESFVWDAVMRNNVVFLQIFLNILDRKLSEEGFTVILRYLVLEDINKDTNNNILQTLFLRLEHNDAYKLLDHDNAFQLLLFFIEKVDVKDVAQIVCSNDKRKLRWASIIWDAIKNRNNIALKRILNVLEQIAIRKENRDQLKKVALRDINNKTKTNILQALFLQIEHNDAFQLLLFFIKKVDVKDIAQIVCSNDKSKLCWASIIWDAIKSRNNSALKRILNVLELNVTAKENRDQLKNVALRDIDNESDTNILQALFLQIEHDKSSQLLLFFIEKVGIKYINGVLCSSNNERGKLIWATFIWDAANKNDEKILRNFLKILKQIAVEKDSINMVKDVALRDIDKTTGHNLLQTLFLKISKAETNIISQKLPSEIEYDNSRRLFLFFVEEVGMKLIDGVLCSSNNESGELSWATFIWDAANKKNRKILWNMMKFLKQVIIEDDDKHKLRGVALRDIDETTGSNILQTIADHESTAALQLLSIVIEKAGITSIDDVVSETDERSIRQILSGSKNLEMRKWAKQFGTFLHRYKIIGNSGLHTPPVHESDSCTVYFATDTEKSPTDPKASVAIKIMKYDNHFHRELQARLKEDCISSAAVDDDIPDDFNKYDAEYVVPLYRYHNCEDRDGLKCTCLILERGTKSLYHIIDSEKISGNDVNKIILYGKSMAEALQHVHNKNYVHGDFKPRNIVRSPNGDIKLIDFDASIQIGDALSDKKKSTAYISPELARVEFRPTESINELKHTLEESMIARNKLSSSIEDEEMEKELNQLITTMRAKIKVLQNTDGFNKLVKADKSLDIWSFGVTMFFLCTEKENLFNFKMKDDTLQTVGEEIHLMNWNGLGKEEFNKILPYCNNREVKEKAKSFFQRCLHPRQEKRFQSMDEILKHPFFANDEPLKEPSKEPRLWAISYNQLIELYEREKKKYSEAEFRSKTMRDINGIVIKPLCKEKKKCYSLAFNPDGLLLDVFVSHSWDEPFPDFVESIMKAYQAKLRKPNFWICSFALFQGDSKSIKELLKGKDDSLDASPFVRALKGASQFLVVRNAKTDLYSRIWCVCELMYAKDLGLVPSKTFVAGPDTFSNEKTSCMDANSWSADDKKKILDELQRKHDVKDIDAFVDEFRKFQQI